MNREGGALQTALAAALHGLMRFPLMVASGWVAATVGVWLVSEPEVSWYPERVLVSALLGVPLFFSLALVAERRAQSSGALATERLLIQAAGLLPLLWFAWRFPSLAEDAQALRIVQLALIFHLAASVLPYLGVSEPRGFWQYNKTLLLRALTTGIWAAVLFAALALALGALDVLFGLEVVSERYLQLWILITLGFSVWFFAAGIPQSLESLNSETDYPRSLRYFVQYLLVPIVAVYLCILTAYLAKVLITREWPSGWIGWLVSCVSVVGTLCWLLLQPLTGGDEGDRAFKWIRTFSRGFFFAILPAIGMLLAALSQRVSQYGLTEPRVALFVLSIWFAGVALFYLVTRSRNILIVPLSLAIVTLVTFAGPLSISRLSRESQLARLEIALRNAGMLQGDSLVARADSLPRDSVAPVRNALSYMYARHGASSLPWPLLSGLDSIADESTQATNRTARSSVFRRQTTEAMRRLGAGEPVPAFRPATKTRQPLNLRPGPVTIEGYSLHIPFSLTYSMSHEQNANGRRAGTAVHWDSARTAAVVFVDSAAVATLRGTDVIAAFDTTPRTPGSPLELTLRDDFGQPYLLVVHSLGVGTVESGDRLESMSGSVYLKRPR